MVVSVVQPLLTAPAVPDPPARGWRDWLLVGLLVPAIVVEGIFHTEVVWRPVTTVAVSLVVLTLLWRRARPLAMLTVAFFVPNAIDTAARLTGDGPPYPLYAGVFLLLLPYAVGRWASGRHVLAGFAVMVATIVVTQLNDFTGVGDMVGGSIVLTFPLVLGIAVRHLTESRSRGLESARARERALLARELHDSVAHHVSAIAIQAQAGQVASLDRPAAATEALAVIEEAASQTLTEMRTIVRGLRRQGDDETVDLAPQPGLADIEGLARHRDEPGAPVSVELSGDLDHLSSSLDTALYRLTQESVTNAQRHARGASGIVVRIVGGADCVHLTVADDGHPVDVDPDAAGGFGLLGMAERTKLLGGTLRAGPGPGAGWTVDAVLPRQGVGP